MSKKKESDPRGDLGNVIDADDALVTRERKPGMKKRKKEESRVKEADFMPADVSARILSMGREQQLEVEQEEERTIRRRRTPGSVGGSSAGRSVAAVAKANRAKKGGNDSDGDDDDDYDSDGEDDVEVEEIDEDDERALAFFMAAKGAAMRDAKGKDGGADGAGGAGGGGLFQPRPTVRLCDLIMEKLKEKEDAAAGMDGGADGGGGDGGDEEDEIPDLDPAVSEAYDHIGTYLKRYKSGKLPKAFKMIPNLKHWEYLLYLTSPDEWTPHAVYAATKIFASNLNNAMAQRFYNLVLLPRVRDDIDQNKKLNYHLYSAVKKAIFKPAAFNRGILLPLAESQNCTLREGLIMSSVLEKISIPVLHAAAALQRLAEMEYTPANSIFIRTLLSKKYALPHKTLAALADHFVAFQHEKYELPVLWHQSLLVFVQRYKHEFTEEAVEAIKGLLRVQQHHTVTDEIRRELFHEKDGAVAYVKALKAGGKNAMDEGGDSGGEEAEEEDDDKKPWEDEMY